jgi:hypothetical protein
VLTGAEVRDLVERMLQWSGRGDRPRGTDRGCHGRLTVVTGARPEVRMAITSPKLVTPDGGVPTGWPRDLDLQGSGREDP